MARTRVLATSAVMLVLVAGVAVLGWVVGAAIAEHRADSKQQLTREGLTEFLNENIKGIGVGQPFPDFPIWSCGTSESYTIRDLLPDGGVVFLAGADCGSCVETAAAFQEATHTLGSAAQPAIFLLDKAEATVPFKEALALRGVDIPLYCDATESMRREHTVGATRVYFRIDAEGIVTEFAPLMPNTAETIAQVLTE